MLVLKIILISTQTSIHILPTSEHTHILMGKYMWGNGKVGVLGLEQNTTKTGKPLESG